MLFGCGSASSKESSYSVEGQLQPERGSRSSLCQGLAQITSVLFLYGRFKMEAQS